MKRFLYSILAVATLAGCTNNDMEDVLPAEESLANEPELVYVEVGATNGETKATFEGDLNAYWEAGDQILAVQGLSTTDERRNNISLKWTDVPGYSTAIGIRTGEGTANARFNGDVNEYLGGGSSYVHFAYPAAGSSLSTNVSLDYNTINVSDRKATTTCSFTVPAAQDAKWTPAMFGSTATPVALSDIGEVAFKNVNSCLSIFVFEKDKTTPKKIESIRITAANNIVGTISATTPVSKNGNPLTADLFTPNATGNTITASNLGSVAAVNGNYEYRFEVLPVNAGEISIEVIDAAGSIVTRKVNLGKSFAANTRHKVRVSWDPASITSGDATSWYEDYATNPATGLTMGAIYVHGAKIAGVGASEVSEVGIKVGSEYRKADVDYSSLRNIELSVSGIASGKYAVAAYAKLTDGTVVETTTQEVEVFGNDATTTAHVYSTYNYDGGVNMQNISGGGNTIFTDVAVSNSYVKDNLVASTTLYSDSTALASASGGASPAKTDCSWTLYPACHVVVILKNGYPMYTSAKYDTNVTGLPFEADWTTTNYPTSAGWAYDTCTDDGEYLQIKTGKTGGFVTPAFHVPGDISLDVQLAGGTSGTGNGYWYVNAVNSQSISTANGVKGTNGYMYNTSYATWNGTTPVLKNNGYNKVSVVIYGGKIYSCRISKVYFKYK